MPFRTSAPAAGACVCACAFVSACGNKLPAIADATVVPTADSRKRRRVNPSFCSWFLLSGVGFFMAVSVEEGIILCAMGWRKNINGARGGNRTHTALRPPDFEGCDHPRIQSVY